MLRKILLLALISLATVAAAAPMAQALEWRIEPNDPVEMPMLFGASGEITMEIGGLKTGPAVVEIFPALLENDGADGKGEIERFEISPFLESIPTNLPGCVATSATSSDGEGGGTGNWPIALSGEDSIQIEAVTITYHYGEGCAKYGVPSTVSAAGVITGTMENSAGEACILLNKSGDLKNEATEGAVTLTAKICILGFTVA